MILRLKVRKMKKYIIVGCMPGERTKDRPQTRWTQDVNVTDWIGLGIH